MENARILIANTPMDTDKIKVFGSRVKVERVSQVAEIELAEKEKMKDKVSYKRKSPSPNYFTLSFSAHPLDFIESTYIRR